MTKAILEGKPGRAEAKAEDKRILDLLKALDLIRNDSGWNRGNWSTVGMIAGFQVYYQKKAPDYNPYRNRCAACHEMIGVGEIGLTTYQTKEMFERGGRGKHYHAKNECSSQIINEISTALARGNTKLEELRMKLHQIYNETPL